MKTKDGETDRSEKSVKHPKQVVLAQGDLATRPECQSLGSPSSFGATQLASNSDY